jgi:hypothetical protein
VIVPGVVALCIVAIIAGVYVASLVLSWPH